MLIIRVFGCQSLTLLVCCWESIFEYGGHSFQLVYDLRDVEPASTGNGNGRSQEKQDCQLGNISLSGSNTYLGTGIYVDYCIAFF